MTLRERTYLRVMAELGGGPYQAGAIAEMNRTGFRGGHLS
jgi:hypothetical protein